MKKIILFIISFLTWACLDWPLNLLQLVIGILASIVVVYVVEGLFLEHPEVWKQPRRYFYYFSLYLPAVVWEMTKANIDAAWRILHPGRPLRPGIVKVKTTLTNDLALTALANSISYMPGALVVDIDQQNGFLYVHWNDVKATDLETATKLIVERFEKILSKVFF
jgi:multicomponent Na+:H+ antiporter subunit E